MANVSIAQFMKSISQEMPDENVFIYGKTGFQNLVADEALELVESKYLIFLDEPITSNDEFTQGGAVFSPYNVKMMFAKKSDLGWTYEQHDVVIAQMRSVSRDFILRLLASVNSEDGSKNIKSIANVSRTNVQNVLDVNLSGVVCSFQITPYNDDGICIVIAEPKLAIEVSQTCNGTELNVTITCAFENCQDFSEIILEAKSHFDDDYDAVETMEINEPNGSATLEILIQPDYGQGEQIDLRWYVGGDIYSTVYSTALNVCSPSPTIIANTIQQTCNGTYLSLVAFGTWWNADGFTTINLQIETPTGWQTVGNQPTSFETNGLIEIGLNVEDGLQGQTIEIRFQLTGSTELPDVYSEQQTITLNNCGGGNATTIEILSIT